MIARFFSYILGAIVLNIVVVLALVLLLVGVLATVSGLAAGLVIGVLAGAFGGWIDTVLMRVTDVLLSIPSLLLAISVAALAARPSQTTVIIAVALVNVPIFARLLRGSMLAQRDSDHVLAATALGVKRRAVVLRHMLPNAIGPVIVQATLTLATAILDAAALSFLGLGSQPPQADLGSMLGEARSALITNPHTSVVPGLMILVIVMAILAMVLGITLGLVAGFFRKLDGVIARIILPGKQVGGWFVAILLGLLGAMVGIGNEICRALFGHLQVFDFPEIARKRAARRAGCGDHDGSDG